MPDTCGGLLAGLGAISGSAYPNEPGLAPRPARYIPNKPSKCRVGEAHLLLERIINYRIQTCLSYTNPFCNNALNCFLKISYDLVRDESHLLP